MQVVVDRTEGQVFRERVGFLVLCIIGAYCLMRILIELRSILEPFLWALFLVMAWKPVVDGFEHRIEALLAVSCSMLRSEFSRTRQDLSRSQARPLGRMPAEDSEDDDLVGETQSMISTRDTEVAMVRAAEGAERCQDVDDEDSDSGADGSRRNRLRRSIARLLAVLMATMSMLGLLSGFGFMIMESARHMRDHWDVYTKGAQMLTNETNMLFKQVPDSMKKQYQEMSVDIVKAAQDFLYALLGDFVNNVSSLLFGVLLTMLYTLFWLISPVPMDSSIDIMFRKYIMFKTLACFGYGMSAGLLLYFLSVDLASVFALTTFALNFVPE
ncbi:unnamed protein product, partial [Polarella glacialis]